MTEPLEWDVCVDCFYHIAELEINEPTEQAIKDSGASFRPYPLTRYCVVVECDLWGEENHEVIATSESEARKEVEEEGYTIISIEDVTDSHSCDEFSWRECELCGSILGGSRYKVTSLSNI